MSGNTRKAIVAVAAMVVLAAACTSQQAAAPVRHHATAVVAPPSTTTTTTTAATATMAFRALPDIHAPRIAPGPCRTSSVDSHRPAAPVGTALPGLNDMHGRHLRLLAPSPRGPARMVQ